MIDYTPDRWEIIKIEQEEGTVIYKILSGWSGGYLDSDYWRMSSGLTKITENDDHYLMENESGSTYLCRKDSQGFTTLSGGIFNTMKDNSERHKVKVSVSSVNEYNDEASKKHSQELHINKDGKNEF